MGEFGEPDDAALEWGEQILALLQHLGVPPDVIMYGEDGIIRMTWINAKRGYNIDPEGCCEIVEM